MKISVLKIMAARNKPVWNSPLKESEETAPKAEIKTEAERGERSSK